MNQNDEAEIREQFMAVVYDWLHDDGTNDRANRIIEAFDDAQVATITALQAEAERLRAENERLLRENCHLMNLTMTEYMELCRANRAALERGKEGIDG